MAIAATTYPVSRWTGVCAATGRALQEGELCVAVLIEREGAKALERLDYSVPAWEAGQRPAPPTRVFGFWRAKFIREEAPRNPLLGDDELFDLFEELAGATEHKQVVFRYVLTLLLVRRRVLRLMGSRSGSLLVLSKGATGDPIVVADPGMDESSTAEAIEQLSQVVAPEGPALAPGAAGSPAGVA